MFVAIQSIIEMYRVHLIIVSTAQSDTTNFPR